MNAALVSIGTFACVFGAGYLATRLRRTLPEHHLSADTKDTVKLTMGLVATMTALVLGLLVASTKASYDAEKAGVISISAKAAMLDRMLAHYGPDSAHARDLLRQAFQGMINHLWPTTGSQAAQLDPTASSGEELYDTIEELQPQNDNERNHKALAMAAAVNLGQARWLLYEQSGSSISPPLLVIVVCWLGILFFSFGLFAPPNHTALSALLISAICVSGAVFLILELDHPFGGLIHIPSIAAETALAHLGR